MRKKRSIIWKISKEELEKIVKESSYLRDVLNFLGLKNKGATPNVLKERLKLDLIDFSHFLKNIKEQRLNNCSIMKKTAIPIELMMTENSNYSRNYLKHRIIKEKLLEYKCIICKNNSIWNNKPLSLQLDHINGIPNDNRLENLRFLCPNCHSQTDTFGRKRKISITEKELEEKKLRKIEIRKAVGEKLRKVKNRPNLEQLKLDIEELGYKGTGRKYKVSDNCIRNWIKK